MRLKSTLLAVAALLPMQAFAAVVVTFEAPTVQNTTQAGVFSVETFTGATANFGQGYSDTVGPINFSYSGVDVRAADQYGGAGGTGLYAATYSGFNSPPLNQSTGSYTLNVSSALPTPIDYFGAWFSAQDDNNLISFYKAGNLVYTFTPVNVLASSANVGNYLGNPNAPFTGQDGSQAYVFANIYFDGGSYDSVVFAAASQSMTGFETDNHTVGTFTPPITGYGVPEAATWAMMIAGFGMTGAAMRRRRVSAAC